MGIHVSTINEDLMPMDAGLDQLAPAEQAELEALTYLSNDALRVVADEQLPNQEQERMASLMEFSSKGKLTTEEHAELTTLVEQGDQLMLRKAEAVMLLWRSSYIHGTKNTTTDSERNR